MAHKLSGSAGKAAPPSTAGLVVQSKGPPVLISPILEL